jgi:hypothetical protein
MVRVSEEIWIYDLPDDAFSNESLTVRRSTPTDVSRPA